MITAITVLVIGAVLALTFETTRVMGIMLTALLCWVYPVAFVTVAAIGGALVYYYRQRR